MIRRIHIRNYKSLLDVEVVLKPLSLLFGPNASGKSNFIDALQLLSRVATSRTLKEAFELARRGAIDSAFEEAHSDRLPVSARMMRGDFDA
ncbi:MAG: AAA family ATPase [Bryobacterales bacterium]|nr:AAA family ATPase [Bryobacterales bacterium]